MLAKKEQELLDNKKPLCLKKGEFVSILESVPSKGFDIATPEEIPHGKLSAIITSIHR